MLSILFKVYFWISFFVFTYFFFKFISEIDQETGKPYTTRTRIIMSLICGFIAWPLGLYKALTMKEK